MISRFVASRPALGSALMVWNLLGILSLLLSAPPRLVLACSLSLKINIKKCKNNRKRILSLRDRQVRWIFILSFFLLNVYSPLIKLRDNEDLLKSTVTGRFQSLHCHYSQRPRHEYYISGALFSSSYLHSFRWCAFAMIFLRLFILRERERETERILSRLYAVGTEPNVGLDLMNCEIMSWAEIKSQPLNRLSHPGTFTISWFTKMSHTHRLPFLF